MHLTEMAIRRLADGETMRAGDASARWHVAGCAQCAEALARREAWDRATADLLCSIDDAPPVVSPDILMARARRRWAPRWGAIAAGIAAVGVAMVAVAAAVPHSALRRYLGHLVHGPVPVRHQGHESDVAGVGYTAAKAVNVIFQHAQTTGAIRVGFSDSTLVRVAHRSGTAGYTLTPDGVVIANAGSRASYEVTLPRTALVARIRVDGRVVFERDGARIVAAVPPDSQGRYLISLAEPGAP